MLRAETQPFQGETFTPGEPSRESLTPSVSIPSPSRIYEILWLAACSLSSRQSVSVRSGRVYLSAIPPADPDTWERGKWLDRAVQHSLAKRVAPSNWRSFSRKRARFAFLCRLRRRGAARHACKRRRWSSLAARATLFFFRRCRLSLATGLSSRRGRKE